MQDLEKKEEELYYENQMKETFNQGMEEKTTSIIKEMLKEKSSYEFISKITGKSIKEIKEIEKSISID